ncbi:RNA-binding domain-containing protein [Lindgomyces ingoldianus]|uniref:RNA-binding domain-containing protein n=1 Tax=Lindgomyces ingoldianus TaxID=673940 RepID=A0ACB6RE25_9PLEO|nr:RNA-binding domain-containing protein [Lindgomyces ingoldianus]KAF2476587.1 RNA-binding domain-containing protein [Lindgomyces ingoldianus]
MASIEYDAEPRGYDDEPRGYDRDRSRSPRGERRDTDDARARSASPNGRDSRGPPPPSRSEDDEGSVNPGSNLFVTGIHPSLTEEDVTQMFEKFGEVEKCNIMRDPHTKESRGFGFVKMVTSDGADAAKDGLQGEVHQGRTLSIEKARRARPRTPTPGKYYGPPKRGEFPTQPSFEAQSLSIITEFRGRGGRFGDRYEDRRGGGGGGYGRRDDYGGGYRGSRYGDREDRGYRRDRDDYGPRGVDRYASRDDRYSSSRGDSRGDDRRGGGGGGYYDRPPPPPAGGSAGYGDAPPPRPEAYSGSGGRSYDDRDPKRY